MGNNIYKAYFLNTKVGKVISSGWGKSEHEYELDMLKGMHFNVRDMLSPITINGVEYYKMEEAPIMLEVRKN